MDTMEELNKIYRLFFETVVKIEQDTYCYAGFSRQVKQLIEETKKEIKVAKTKARRDRT